MEDSRAAARSHPSTAAVTGAGDRSNTVHYRQGPRNNEWSWVPAPVRGTFGVLHSAAEAFNSYTVKPVATFVRSHVVRAAPQQLRDYCRLVQDAASDFNVLYSAGHVNVEAVVESIAELKDDAVEVMASPAGQRFIQDLFEVVGQLADSQGQLEVRHLWERGQRVIGSGVGVLPHPRASRVVQKLAKICTEGIAVFRTVEGQWLMAGIDRNITHILQMEAIKRNETRPTADGSEYHDSINTRAIGVEEEEGVIPSSEERALQEKGAGGGGNGDPRGDLHEGGEGPPAEGLQVAMQPAERVPRAGGYRINSVPIKQADLDIPGMRMHSLRQQGRATFTPRVLADPLSRDRGERIAGCVHTASANSPGDGRDGLEEKEELSTVGQGGPEQLLREEEAKNDDRRMGGNEGQGQDAEELAVAPRHVRDGRALVPLYLQEQHREAYRVWSRPYFGNENTGRGGVAVRQSAQNPAPSPRTGLGCALAKAMACLTLMGRLLTVGLAVLHIASYFALAAIVFPASRRRILGPTQPTPSTSCAPVSCSVAEVCGPLFFALRGQTGEGGEDILLRSLMATESPPTKTGLLAQSLEAGDSDDGNGSGGATGHDAGEVDGGSSSDLSADARFDPQVDTLVTVSDEKANQDVPLDKPDGRTGPKHTTKEPLLTRLFAHLFVGHDPLLEGSATSTQLNIRPNRSSTSSPAVALLGAAEDPRAGAAAAAASPVGASSGPTHTSKKRTFGRFFPGAGDRNVDRVINEGNGQFGAKRRKDGGLFRRLLVGVGVGDISPDHILGGATG